MRESDDLTYRTGYEIYQPGMIRDRGTSEEDQSR